MFDLLNPFDDFLIVLRRDLIDELTEAPAPSTPTGIDFSKHFTGVNFINMLRTNFLYKRGLGSFLTIIIFLFWR